MFFNYTGMHFKIEKRKKTVWAEQQWTKALHLPSMVYVRQSRRHIARGAEWTKNAFKWKLKRWHWMAQRKCNGYGNFLWLLFHLIFSPSSLLFLSLESRQSPSTSCHLYKLWCWIAWLFPFFIAIQATIHFLSVHQANKHSLATSQQRQQQQA